MDQQSQFIFRVVVLTLAIVPVSVVLAMLIGLFSPAVDNAEVFKILGPGFQTVVGAFVGILSSMALNKPKDPPKG